MTRRTWIVPIMAVAGLSLAACGGGGGGGFTPSTFTLGGSLSGLGSGQTVVLANNGADSLSLTANGAYTFKTPVTSGSYAVTVSMQPTGQTCIVANASGSSVMANVTDALGSRNRPDRSARVCG